MQYVSTRNKRWRCSASEAIAQGLAPDGGLLTPEVLPKLSPNGLTTMTDMSYQQRAVFVMNSFLEDFTASELSSYANHAYGPDKFDTKEVAPSVQWTTAPTAWSCGTVLPAPLRIWPCRCCPTSCPPRW